MTTDINDIYCFISKILFLYVFNVFNKMKYDLLPVKGLWHLCLMGSLIMNMLLYLGKI